MQWAVDNEAKVAEEQRLLSEESWSRDPTVQRLRAMEGHYPTPDNPMWLWTREHAIEVCWRMGRLHRHPNQSPAGDSLNCNEVVQGCVVREWYLSRR